jgi:hypothetical protein
LYWRGTLKYRFQIAASGYHRGRLKVVWDPATSDAQPEMNMAFTKIIDISETKDFVIEVGWGNNQPGLRINKTRLQSPQNSYQAGVKFGEPTVFDNGVLSVYVLNELVTSGANTAPVRILVHQWSDDLKLWSPAALMQRITTWPQDPPELLDAQSGLDVPQGEMDCCDDDIITTRVGGVEDDRMLFVTAGETCESFRSLIKRYYHRRSILLGGTIAAYNIRQLYANDNNYTITRRGDDSILYNPMSLMRNCFAGWRGGIKWKYIWRSGFDVSTSQGSTLKVTRVSNVGYSNPTSNSSLFDPIDSTSIANAFQATNEVVDESLSGAILSSTSVGRNVEFEVPWYSEDRMSANTEATSLSNNLGHRASLLYANLSDTSVDVAQVYDVYSAASEDFNWYYFCGTPRLFYT